MISEARIELRESIDKSSDLVISDISCRDDDGVSVLSISLVMDGQPSKLTYRCAKGPLADGADTALVAALLPAMKRVTALRSPWPISSRLYKSLPVVQDIFGTWDRGLRKVALDVPVRNSSDGIAGTGVGAFFSGGVDSFFTVLRHLDEITTLIFVHGFDVHLDDQPLRLRVSESLQRAAMRLGKPLVEVETNLRSFSEQHVAWDFYHGAALASVAALFTCQLKRVYIPSTYTYAHLFPWGSHPLVDPLWSLDTLEIVHDSADVGRLEKIRHIATSEVALDHLRVCYENTDGEYNCGRCGKCLRTMVSLHIVGALERCATFTRPIDLHAVARLRFPGPRPLLQETISAAEAWGKDPRLVRALRDSMNDRYYRGFWALLDAVQHSFRDPPRLAWVLFRAAFPAPWRAYARRVWKRAVGTRISRSPQST